MEVYIFLSTMCYLQSGQTRNGEVSNESQAWCRTQFYIYNKPIWLPQSTYIFTNYTEKKRKTLTLIRFT